MQRLFATLSSPFSNGSSSKSKSSRRKERGRRGEQPIIVDNPKAMIVHEYGSQVRRASTMAPPYRHASGAYRQNDPGVDYRSSKSVDVTHHRDHYTTTPRTQGHHSERRGSTRHRRRRPRSRSYESSRSRSSSRERPSHRHDYHHYSKDRRDNRRWENDYDGDRYYHSRPPSPSPRYRDGPSTQEMRRAASVPRQTLERGRPIAPPPVAKPPTIRTVHSFYASDSSSDISEARSPSPTRMGPPLPGPGSGPGFAPPQPPGLGTYGYSPYPPGSHAPGYMAHAPGYNPYQGPMALAPGPPGYSHQTYNQFSSYPGPPQIQQGYEIPRGRPDEPRWRGSHGGREYSGHPRMNTAIPPVLIGGSAISGPPDAQYNTLYAGWSPPPTVVYGMR